MVQAAVSTQALGRTKQQPDLRFLVLRSSLFVLRTLRSSVLQFRVLVSSSLPAEEGSEALSPSASICALTHGGNASKGASSTSRRRPLRVCFQTPATWPLTRITGETQPWGRWTRGLCLGCRSRRVAARCANHPRNRMPGAAAQHWPV